MKKIIYTLTPFLIALLAACSNPEGLEARKMELDRLKAESVELNNKISSLEAEIGALDPEALANKKQTLVSSEKLARGTFVHKIDARGSVASRNNVTISAETMGRVEKVLVSEGQYVQKGSLLIQLDADIVANNISEIQTNLDLAMAIFDRQEKLWKQNIGTEIQYLQARANKEALERRLATLNSQLAQAYIKAPFSGTIDAVHVRVGEMAQPGVPIAQIVGNQKMYIKADISEAFLGAFERGDAVNVKFPVQNMEFVSKVVAVGRVINDQNRTFNLEVSLPESADVEFRPNQVTILSLTDYKVADAITVPTNTILTDDKGKFVYTVAKANGVSVARKVRVTAGKSFNNKTEILSGLQEGVEIIANGYRDVTDGAEVQLATASL